MATITMTLCDTPNGGVSIHTDFHPAVGSPCTPAQGWAMGILNHTHKEWGVHIDAKPGGVDIDAVHRIQTDRVVQPTSAQ